MTQDALRTALIGFGSSGAGIHAPLLSEHPAFRLEAIVTASAERTEGASERFPSAVLLTTAEELIDRSAVLDLVVVATPPAGRARTVETLLRAGVPTVVEKPFALTAEEAAALARVARQSGTPVTAFHNRRWDSAFLTAARALREGRLGEPVRFEGRLERWRPEPRRRWRETEPAARGGGVIMDLMPHLVDMALNLLGPVTSVACHASALTTTADDTCVCMLGHANGAVSVLSATSVAAAPGPRIRLLGKDAAFVSGSAPHEDAALWQQDCPERALWLCAGGEAVLVEPEPTGWSGFYDAVHAWLRRGGPAPVDPAEAVDVMTVLDALRAAAVSPPAGRQPLALYS